jgi:RNase P subunit RPR2
MCRVDYADEYCQELDTATPTARKEHRCDECRRTISPGETYERFTGIQEGELVTSKTCAHCLRARQWLFRQCSGWVFSEVLEELEEHWQEEPDLRSRELARFIVGMRRQWQHKGERMAVPA